MAATQRIYSLRDFFLGVLQQLKEKLLQLFLTPRSPTTSEPLP